VNEKGLKRQWQHQQSTINKMSERSLNWAKSKEKSSQPHTNCVFSL